MTSFASLLSSISGQPAATPQPRPPTASRPPNGATTASARPQAVTNGVGPASNTTAGVKRKADGQAAPERAKIVKTEGSTSLRPPGQPAPSTTSPAAPYRGTARATGAANPVRPVAKPVSRATTVSSSSPSASASGAPPAADGAPKKKGFAALMERAKAAQQIAKTVGTGAIKHKPLEKVNKREKARMQEEGKGKAVGKAGKVAAIDRSRSNTPMDGKAGIQKKPVESGYKGTMGKKPAIVRQEFTYKGTMNRAGSGNPPAKPVNKHSSGRSKYDGYVDWDDLDDVEDDEDEVEPYDSDGSDMMDAGFDDMQAEETAALRAAKKEDQEALEEEERLKRVKLERKKKLEALSKNAAAAKKKF